MLRQKTYTDRTLGPGSIEDVYVTFVRDPHNFFVQLESSADTLEKVSSQLQEYYKSKAGGALTSWDLQAPCAALYSDNSWYRGQITGHPMENVLEVQFVDFGNTDFVSVENVCSLPPALLSEPKLSFHCGLQGIAPLQNFWSPEHIAQFEDLVLDKSVTAVFKSYNAGTNTYMVQLMGENDENLNHQFCLQAGLDMACSETGGGNRLGNSRSVQASGDKDLQVTIRAGSLPKPARGIAKSLGVEADGHVASSLKPLQHVRLNVGENVELTVVFVKSPVEFWCQASKFSQQNARMSEELNSEYSTLGMRDLAIRVLQQGCVCAALSSADETWYRAIIEKVTGQDISVFFLDYGNTEIVSIANVKELKETFRGLPAQAVRCSLHGIAPTSGIWSDDAAQVFEELVMDQTFMANILDRDTQESYMVQLFDMIGKKDVMSTFLRMSSDVCAITSGVNISTPGIITKEANSRKLPVLSIPTTSSVSVFLSWVRSPEEFYIQFADNQSVLERLTDGLQEFYTSPNAVPASLLQLGSLVAAKFSEDKAWYRGSILDLGQEATVEFVDFGNSEKVSLADLRQLDSQFSHIPAQAICCCLDGVRPLQGQTWNVDAKHFLERLTESGATCKILGCKDAKYLVKLEVHSKDIAEEMAALAVVRRTPEPGPASHTRQFTHVNLAQGQFTKVYVSHSESVENFYVQLSVNMGDLDSLMSDLNGQSSSIQSRPLTSPQVGMPCVAQFAEDRQWYRAQVQSFTAHDVDVLFVDYGNVQTSPRNTVFRLEPAFLTLPAQAIHCSLDIQEGRNADSLLEKFLKITDEEELDMRVKQKEGSRLIVDLFKINQSVTDELKATLGKITDKPLMSREGTGYACMNIAAGQTIQAYISFIESVSRFWVQVAGTDKQLDNMKETLGQRYGSGSEPALAALLPGQPCCALYNEDGLWYRAVVVSVHGPKVKVRFVDYGNSELVERENVKPISADLIAQPTLAVECCLDGFEPSTSDAVPVAIFENMVTEKELTLTFTGGKNFRVRVGNVDVGESLNKQRLFKEAPVLQVLKEPSPPAGSSDAIITHVEEETGVFYIQLLSAASQLEHLSASVQSMCVGGGIPLKGAISKGTICCACFSADGWWYRSRVLSVSGGKALVQFVDYGNSEYSPTNQLKCLHPDLLATPIQAFPCRLMGLDHWNPQIASMFSKTALDVDVKVRFVGSSSPFDIQVSVNGHDLLRMLSKASSPSPQKTFGSLQRQTGGSPREKSSGWSPKERQSGGFSREKRSSGSPQEKHSGGYSREKRSSLSPQEKFIGSTSTRRLFGGPSASDISVTHKLASDSSQTSPPQLYALQSSLQGTHPAFLSFVAEDGTFYLQLSKDISRIEEIGEKLAALGRAGHITSSPGTACAAVFKEDGAWYRAVIKQVMGGNADVQFVDFGNGEGCDIKSLKPLPVEMLGPALAFHCQLLELGPLTEEQLEVLKVSAMDKELQVIFSNATNPPYEVSIYDNGQNIAITLFKSTQLRAQKVPTGTVPATVVHVEADGKFFIHLIQEQGALQALTTDLQTVCQSGVSDLDIVNVGHVCCVKFATDEMWYRAQILDEDSSVIEVLLVDLGTRRRTEKTSIVKLPSDFMTKSAFAYECRLHGVDKWTEEQKEKFRTMTEKKTVSVSFLSSKPPYDVELTRSIGLELLEGETSSSYTQAVIEKPECKNLSDEGVPLTANDQKLSPFPLLPSQCPPESDACVVSHVDRDGCFYVQLSVGDEARDALTEKLQEECESSCSEVVTSLAVGSLCCAKFSEDGAWYRALVEDIIEDSVVVRFIDYGNKDVVAKEDLRSLTPYSSNVPPLSYSCRLELDGCTAAKEEICSKLEEIALEHTLHVRFVDPNQSHPYTVRLTLEDGSSVTDIVASQVAVNKGISDVHVVRADETKDTSDVYITPMDETKNTSDVRIMAADETETFSCNRNRRESCDSETITISPGQQIPVIISHVVSPSLFYIQREDSQGCLNSLMDSMFEHYSNLEECHIKKDYLVNQLCAAQFGDDETWYRAKVTALCADTDSCDLFFTDFGNTATVPCSSVYTLSTEFESVPRQSTACRLAGVTNIGNGWSQDVVAAFEELVTDKVLIANVIEGDGTENSYIVHLYSSGVSVALSLLELGLPGVFAEEPVVQVVQESSVSKSQKTVGNAVVPDTEEYTEDVADIEADQNTETNAVLESTWVGTLKDVECLDKCDENKIDFSRCPKAEEPHLESTMLEEECSAVMDVGHKGTTEDAADSAPDAIQSECAVMTEGTATYQPELNSSVFAVEEIESALRIGLSENSADGLEISQPILQSTVLGDTFSQSCDARVKFEMVPEFRCEAFEVGKEYQVNVNVEGEPDAFYVTRVDSKDLLQTLADRIALEIADTDADTQNKIFVDSPCLVQDSGLWLRAQVQIVTDSMCKILCVDTGNVLRVNKDQIRDLPAHFLDIPTLFVPCALADVVPVDGSWCDNALSFFSDFVKKDTLHLFVASFSESTGVYNVMLRHSLSKDEASSCFTSFSTEPSLNSALVELGYAEAVPGSALDVEIQLEKTIDDPEQMGQFEASFSEVACHRENSLGQEDVDKDEETAGGEEEKVVAGEGESRTFEDDDRVGDSKGEESTGEMEEKGQRDTCDTDADATNKRKASLFDMEESKGHAAFEAERDLSEEMLVESVGPEEVLEMTTADSNKTSAAADEEEETEIGKQLKASRAGSSNSTFSIPEGQINDGLKVSNLSVGYPEYFKEQKNDSQTACNDNRFENCEVLPTSQADLADDQGCKVSQEEEDCKQEDPCSMLSGISVGDREAAETVTVGLEDTPQHAQVSAVSSEEVADLEGVGTCWASTAECVNVDQSLVDACLESGVCVYRSVNSVVVDDEKGAEYTTHMENITTAPSFTSITERTEEEEFKVNKPIEDNRVCGVSDLLEGVVFSSWGHKEKQPELPPGHGCGDHKTDGPLEAVSNENDETLEEAVFHMSVLADDSIHLVKEHQDQSQDKIDLSGQGILTPWIEADSKTEEFGGFSVSATITGCSVMEKVESYCCDTPVAMSDAGLDDALTMSNVGHGAAATDSDILVVTLMKTQKEAILDSAMDNIADSHCEQEGKQLNNHDLLLAPETCQHSIEETFLGRAKVGENVSCVIAGEEILRSCSIAVLPTAEATELALNSCDHRPIISPETQQNSQFDRWGSPDIDTSIIIAKAEVSHLGEEQMDLVSACPSPGVFHPVESEISFQNKSQTLKTNVHVLPFPSTPSVYNQSEGDCHQNNYSSASDQTHMSGYGANTMSEMSALCTNSYAIESASGMLQSHEADILLSIKGVTEANVLSKPKYHHYVHTQDLMEQNDRPNDHVMETKQNCYQSIKGDQSHNQSGSHAIEREQNYVHLQRSVHDKTRLELCGQKTCRCYSLALGEKSPFDWEIGPKGDCRKLKGLLDQQNLRDYSQETIIQDHHNIVYENNLETAAKDQGQKLVGYCVQEIDKTSVKEVQEDFKFVHCQDCASGEDTNVAENRINKIFAFGDNEGAVLVTRKIQSSVNEAKEQKINRFRKEHSSKECDKITDAESGQKQKSHAGIFHRKTNIAADMTVHNYSRQASHRTVAYDDQTAGSHQQPSIWHVEWELTQRHDTDKSLQNEENQPLSLTVQEPDLGVDDHDDGFRFNIQDNLLDVLHQNHLGTVESQIHNTEVAGQDLLMTGGSQIAASLTADQDLLVTRTNQIIISAAVDQECSLQQDCWSISDEANSNWMRRTSGHTLVTDAKDNILETESQDSILQAGPHGAGDNYQEVSDRSFSPDDLEDVAGTLEHMAEMEHENLAAEELEEQVEHIAELMDEQGNIFEPYDGEMGLEGWKDADSCRCNSGEPVRRGSCGERV